MTPKTDKNIKEIIDGKTKLSFDYVPKVDGTITVGDFLRTWCNELSEDNAQE